MPKFAKNLENGPEKGELNDLKQLKQPSKTTFLGQIKPRTMSNRVVKGWFRGFLDIKKGREGQARSLFSEVLHHFKPQYASNAGSKTDC